MRITIIPSSGIVSINGETYGGLDLSWIDPSINAIQWYKTYGDLEIRNPTTGRMEDNQLINSLVPWQQALDQWAAAKAALQTPPVEVIVPQSISRRQCAIEMRERGMISPQEALDMVKYGEMPDMVRELIEHLPEEERILIETDFAADSYYRNNTLLVSLMTATGATSDDIDDFFVAASAR